MTYRTLKLIIILCLFTSNGVLHAQSIPLFINEFMASNTRSVADELGEFDDWIEIFNAGENSINLQNLYLTDDLSNPTKWMFPNVTLPAKDFLILWADDSVNQGVLHTNFKLSADGESIGIFDGSNFIDSVTFGQQKADISYGRFPDGSDNWFFYSTPSPGSTNPTSHSQFAENPVFSPLAGFYFNPVDVEITAASPQATIYYTLDCSTPSNNSLVYSAPVQLTKTTVIRAIVYQPDHNPSDTRTSTYVIDTDFDIAALSLVTDPPNLWNPVYGIYVNPNERGENWERPASVEFFEPNSMQGFAENIGIRIHGKTAQNYEKKPFRFYFRAEFGASWLNYQLFEDKISIDEFKRFVLHSGGTDMPANPYGYGWTLLRDPLMYELGRRTGCLYPAIRPVALLLNGEPWGIYNFEERIDKYFTKSNFGELDVDMIENDRIAKEGDLTEWESMRLFFKEHDLNSEENFTAAKKLVDIDNVTNYNIVEIFGGNGDWPGNNQLAYRARKAGELWRWILWDMDGCFGPYGVYANTLELATDPDHPSALVLRKLLENENYKILFVNRFTDLLNTLFKTSSVTNLIDSLAANIRNDISFETDKWGSSQNSWEEDGIYGELYPFAEIRPGVVWRHIKQHFDLDKEATLTAEAPLSGEGIIRINSLLIDNYPWHGTYFSVIPIELEAIPAPGYKFTAWDDSTFPQTPKIKINLDTDLTISALFGVDPVDAYLVINEINYNSAPHFDPGDWIELYNPSEDSADVSGWHLRDDDDDHDFLFPESTQVRPHGFLVLCQNQSAFNSHFPGIENCIGNFEFGLSGSGDMVRIYHANWTLIDSVKYDDSPPWQTAPDGTGPTLELMDPGLDNALAENWQSSIGFGTPGKPNSDPTSLFNYTENSRQLPVKYILYQNHPNPFNGTTQIKYHNTISSTIQIIVFNLLGEKIRTILNANVLPGTHSIKWDGKNECGKTMPSGIYMYRLNANNFIQTKKMVRIH